MSGRQPVNASLSARIVATITGPHAAPFGIVAVSGVVAVVSIIYNSAGGLLIGGGGLLLGAANLFFLNSPWGRKPDISTVALTESDGSTLSVRAPTSEVGLRFLREILQGRKPLPNPIGRVLDNPADKNGLQTYTPEESEAAAAKIQNDIEEFERKVAADAMQRRAESDRPRVGKGGGAIKLD